MERRTLSIVAVLLASMMLAVPLASEDSDATGSGRAFIGSMVYHTEFVVPDETWYHNMQIIVVLDGSEKHRAIEEFIEDPLGSDLSSEPSDDITDKTGSKAHIYQFTTDILSWIDVDIGSNTYTLRIEGIIPEHTGFQMKAGDTVRFTLVSGITNTGQSLGCSITPSNGGEATSVVVGGTVEITAPGTMSYILMPDSYPYDAVYVDFVYEIEGNSTPNGSATLFAAVCFVVAALTIVLLVLGAIPPRWSK